MMQFTCLLGEIHGAFSISVYIRSVFLFSGMNEGSVFSKFVLFLQSLEIVDGLGMPVSFISMKANSVIDFCRTNSASEVRANGTFGITFR